MWTNSKPRPTRSAHSCRNATSSRNLENRSPIPLEAWPIQYRSKSFGTLFLLSQVSRKRRNEWNPTALWAWSTRSTLSLLQRTPFFGCEEVPADPGNIRRSSMAKTSGMSTTRTAFGVFGSCSCPRQMLRRTWTTFSGSEPAKTGQRGDHRPIR
jgi:hypothetical protein